MSAHGTRLSLVAALVAVASAAPGCARRTDAATRNAWQGGKRPPTSGDGPVGATDGRGGDTPRGPGARPPAFGWDRVAQLLDESVELMRLSPDDATFAEVAQRWCEVETEARPTPDGPVHVCFPSPQVNLSGARLSVELGGPGVIGLVVRDVSAEDAQRLVTKAEGLAEHHCQAPWADAQSESAPAADRTQRFRTCPVGGGPILAVGRFALDGTPDRWQVSVAIIGAS